MIKHEKGEFRLMDSIGYPEHIAWSIRVIAIMLYGDDSERSQNHILNISKFKLRSGCGFDFYEQKLRFFS